MEHQASKQEIETAVRMVEQETEAITTALQHISWYCEEIFDSLAYVCIAKQYLVGCAEQSKNS